MAQRAKMSDREARQDIEANGWSGSDYLFCAEREARAILAETEPREMAMQAPYIWASCVAAEREARTLIGRNEPPSSEYLRPSCWQGVKGLVETERYCSASYGTPASALAESLAAWIAQ